MLKSKKILCFRILLFGCVFFMKTVSEAQSNQLGNKTSNDSLTSFQEIHKSDHKQKDIQDVVKKIFKINIALDPDSSEIKPGRLLFTFLPFIGYTLETGAEAIASVNVSFYRGHKKANNLSSISTNSQYSLFNHQIIIPIILNIWSKGNTYNWLGDYRYYKYPTYTYGLGGQSSLSKSDLIDYSYIRIYQEVLKNISPDFFAGLGYNMDYHFNIKEYGAGEIGNLTDFQKYSLDTKTISSGLVFHLLYDGRRNLNNPENGSYASITYRHNFTFLGSNQNWQSLLFDFRKYIKLSSNSENILAFWSFNWFTFGGKSPFLDLPSTAWDTYANLGRGYIQGRLRGPGLVCLESEYRFALSRNGLFGGVVFVNAQAVSEVQNNKFKNVFPGTGLGFRIKANKFSNANIAIDYGFGTGGSQGFFFNICEVF